MKTLIEGWMEKEDIKECIKEIKWSPIFETEIGAKSKFDTYEKPILGKVKIIIEWQKSKK